MAKTSKKNKLSITLKLTIILAVLAFVFFFLALASSLYSVNRTKDAIDAIGDAEYTAESKQKIDAANAYYNSLDKNLNLQNSIDNADKLEQAKLEYVTQALWALHLADEGNDGANDAAVKSLAEETRKAIDDYFAEDERGEIPNYRYLTEIETKYSGGSDNTPNPSDGEQDGDDIELC